MSNQRVLLLPTQVHGSNDKTDDVVFPSSAQSLEKHNHMKRQNIVTRIQSLFACIPRTDGNIIDEYTFSHSDVDEQQLSQKAYNYRWATVPSDTIPLTAADCDFPIAKPIRDAMIQYVHEGYMNYGPAKGLPALREMIATQRDTSSSCVFIANAAASAMFLVAKYCLSPGDEVLLSDPVDFLFQRAIESAGGVVVRYALKPPSQSNDHWTFNVNDLVPLVTNKTKMIAICNPHNPVGKVWNDQAISELCALASRFNLTIWSDEVWADISYVPFTPTETIAKRFGIKTFTVIGFSKGYGLAGLRIGAVISPMEADTDAISSLSLAEDTAYGVSVLSQVAAQAALEKGSAWLTTFRKHVQSQCAYCVYRLNQIPHISCTMPEGTFVCFANVSYYLKKSGLDEASLVDYLMKNFKIAAVPGSPRFFGPSAAGHIRLSVATSRKILREGLDRLAKGLMSLLD